MEKNKWDFVYDEECFDDCGRNFCGVLSNGKNYLFWHAYVREEGGDEICSVYDSLWALVEGENKMCEYKWTAENDSILLDCLNNLDDPKDFCGENSPLRRIKFNDNESE